MNYEYKKLREHPVLLTQAAVWFHEKWGIPLVAYQESMNAMRESAPVPQWYACMDGKRFVGGLGVIENDFHNRPDLAPNVCAVYVEEAYRGQGIAGRLLSLAAEDMHAYGVDTLYLLTDHTAFYERYGWEYLCAALGDGEEKPARMYVHRYREA